jgi:hypothetical protein
MDLNFVDVFEIKPQAQSLVEAAEEVFEIIRSVLVLDKEGISRYF